MALGTHVGVSVGTGVAVSVGDSVRVGVLVAVGIGGSPLSPQPVSSAMAETARRPVSVNQTALLAFLLRGVMVR